MRRNRAALAATALVLTGAAAGPSVAATAASEQTAPLGETEITELVKMVQHLARSINMKVVLYGELDDKRGSGRPVLAMDLAGKGDQTPILSMAQGETGDFLRTALDAEMAGPRAGEWRKILIVADKEGVTVLRGRSPGPVEGFDQRRRAEVRAALDMGQNP